MKSPTYTFLLLFLFQSAFAQPQLPEGFNVQTIGDPWEQPTGIVFQEDGTMFVLEKAGVVWRVRDGIKQPFLDIRDEVANHGDMGLMGFIFDPNFKDNGFCYAYYVADFHSVANEDKADFDPTKSWLWRATIARVSRFKATAPDFSSVDITTKEVLIGKTAETGIPVLHESHVGGSLVFGTDGSLLVTTGDASTWKAAYAGNGPPYFEEKAAQGLADKIIRPAEEIGSFRSQLVNSLNGKVLRIDPKTGEGFPSNPFYDINNPSAPRSLVWSLGLRNPFKAVLREGSGSTNVADGLPGSLYIGDVGEGRWEELNIATKAKDNFGWPIFEGIHPIFEYRDQPTFNQDARNPLFGQDGCEQEYFYFQDLIQQISQGPNIFRNPCKQDIEIADSLQFIHHPPDLAIAHITVGDGFYTAAFDEAGEVIRLRTTEVNSPIKDRSKAITANASIPIGFYTGEIFPEQYKGKFFLADHVKGWIKVLEVDLNDQIIGIEDFFQDTIFIPHASFNPADGQLYFIDYKHKVLKKISYNENVPPIVQATADSYYGPSPLNVQFTGDSSYDPQQESISFLWDFGEGMTSTLKNPSHQFQSSNNQPKRVPVQLTVTDVHGATTTKELIISLNNTPPTVKISSLKDGDVYPLTSTTEFLLDAIVNDKEHAEIDLRYAWQTILIHNSHSHSEPIDTNKSTRTLIVPAGCDGENYAYDIVLEVSDAAGLKGKDKVRLYPDCDQNFVQLLHFTAFQSEATITCAWETLTEFDLDFVEVQRKINGTDDFETLHILPSKNIHHIKTAYTFVDEQPQTGNNTYRLKMHSKDGLLAYSLEETVLLIQKGELIYFPNPTDGEVAFYLVPEIPALQLSVFSVGGQLVKTIDWEDHNQKSYPLDLSDLPTGTYFFYIENGAHPFSGKIMKY